MSTKIWSGLLGVSWCGLSYIFFITQDVLDQPNENLLLTLKSSPVDSHGVSCKSSVGGQMVELKPIIIEKMCVL